MSLRGITLIVSGLALCVTTGAPAAARPDNSRQAYPYTAASGHTRKPVLQLFTSEGCSSCPPAEHWLRGLDSKGFIPDRMIALALHVDYWDYLGWKDPYDKAAYTKRQRSIAARDNLQTIYTPQFVLNGKDFRDTGRIDSVVSRINRQSPGAKLRLSARFTSPDAVALKLDTHIKQQYRRDSNQIFIGLTENGLVNRIGAGENAGRTLEHENVVRQLAGPFPITDSRTLRQTLKVPANADRQNLALVAFVQNRHNGNVLQALRLPLH